MLGETIQVTVLSHGVAFVNTDAARRLREVGVIRKGTGKITNYPLSKLQALYLKGFPQIRDLDHYRELVGDPRSPGLMFHFTHGQTVTMVRHERGKKKVLWYAVLDTAIGCRADFLEEMQKLGRLRISSVPAPPGQ